jgi:hypothetical protein
MLADVVVLTEDAFEIASPKENRARTAPSAQTILLAGVREGTGHPSVPTCETDLRIFPRPINMTIARTRATVLQLAKRQRHAPIDFACVKPPVRGLKGVKQESRIHRLHSHGGFSV